jgi:hypothetical protein
MEWKEIIKEINNDGKAVLRCLRDNNFTSSQITHFIMYMLTVIYIEDPALYQAIPKFIEAMIYEIEQNSTT